MRHESMLSGDVDPRASLVLLAGLRLERGAIARPADTDLLREVGIAPRDGLDGHAACVGLHRRRRVARR
jgi:hypothetical protein